MSSPSSPITTRQSLVEWTSRFVQPPAAQYIGKDDLFHVDVATSTVPGRSEIGIRILTPEGEIHIERHIVETTTARFLAHEIFPAREGFLLGFAVSALTTSAAGDWHYATVGLSRSEFGGAHVYHGLAQGYFDLGQPLFWPGQPYRRSTDGPGALRAFTGADPAAGVNPSIEVSEGARWRILALEFELVTDATVANRRFILRVDRTAVGTLFRTAADVVQAASLSFRYVVGHWGESGGDRNGVVLVNWPDHMLLNDDDDLFVEVNGLQAGDNFAAPSIYVEEWFEET